MNIFNIIFMPFKWLYQILMLVFYGAKIAVTTLEYQEKSQASTKKNTKGKGGINHRLVDDQLSNKDYGILKDEYAGLDKAVKEVFFWDDSVGREDTQSAAIQREAKNEAHRQTDLLKTKGDEYEYFIGRQFEKNGELVIYNGFIKGYGDYGVDIIVISSKTKSVNLVQCKNWKNKSFTIDVLQNIYSKLDNYTIDGYLNMECDDINFYLKQPRDNKTILTLLHGSKKYQIRKTLYISSDKVVDLAIGPHLKMMSPSIFKYKDMKMVVKDL